MTLFPILTFEIGVLFFSFSVDNKYPLLTAHLLAYQPASTYVISTLSLVMGLAAIFWYQVVEKVDSTPICKEDKDFWKDHMN